MGFIGSLFGSESGNTGAAGMNYRATGPTQNMVNDAWSNTQSGLGQQQAFMNALAQQNGIQNQSDVFAQQQALANLYAQQAMGQGPNPAQAQFQQNANQVAAQTAGMIGSQKGMSPALQARLIAQQGAGAGQAAAGQAATLQAQQQLAAQQALAQQQANMANLSSQQVGQQQQAIAAYNQGALGQQQNVLGLQGNANTANAGVAGVVAGNQGKMFGGLMNAASGGITHMAQGGMVEGGPSSNVGKYLVRGAISDAPPIIQPMPGRDDSWGPKAASMGVDGGQGMGSVMGGGAGDAAPAAGLGFGAAPVMVAHGGVIQGERYAHQMKPVPGRAVAKGDSGKNDTVDAKLSPGEVIIPRSVMQSKDPVSEAAKFVAAVMAKHGRKIG